MLHGGNIKQACESMIMNKYITIGNRQIGLEFPPKCFVQVIGGVCRISVTKAIALSKAFCQ
jgi:hypothetical protein